MEHLERRDEPTELARPQQVLVAGRSPAFGALVRAERLHQQDATGPDLLDHVRHPRTVKIIEHQNRLKDAPRRPRRVEILLEPLHPEARLHGRLPREREPSGIAIDAGHDRPEARRGERVAAGATGHVENADAGCEAMSLPVKPAGRARDHGGGSIGHGESSPRVAPLAELAATPADLIVIGGGITGAGIARDAALRGLRTVLLEQRDLACGTSGRSSRLVHGGFRYLEHGDFKLVFEALNERTVLRQIAPHLVRPLAFLFPLHQGDRLSLWKLAAGMWLYDLLALFRNVSRHQMLGKRALLAREPALRTAGLKGAARYFDAQCDDARLVVATARSARAAGAAIRTWTGVTGFLRQGSRVTGVVARDMESGAEAELRAAVVVNATGPWVDAVRRLEGDGAVTPLLRRTKGAHVVVPRSRLGHTEAITFLSPVDGRVMFVLPWGEWSYIGTTDTDSAEHPDDVAASEEDVRYLLRSANSRFPAARLSEDDVIATWAGLRALIDDAARVPGAVSREHAIVEGPGGVVTIAGGKLTTYRVMAAEVVNRVIQRVPARDGRSWPTESATDREPLPGGETAELASIRSLGLDAGFGERTVEHLLRHYGTEAAGLYNLARREPALAQPLHPEHPAIAAEVVHAARREFARRVEDVLVRRIHLYYETRDRGAAAAPRTAELLGRELNWTTAEIARQAEEYLALARTGRVLPSG
jgi:glycerol-3-phosphate dehydrogenase